MANMQRTLDLHYDKLIIGADLSALSYSYINKIPLIYLRKIEIPKYNLFNDYKNQYEIYNELLFILSISKYIPFSNLISSIRIADENNLKIITKNNLSCNISFNHLIISDDYNIFGLEAPISKTNFNNLVLDWFDVTRGGKHDFEKIQGDDDFVKVIYFFQNQRTNFNKLNKDCVSLSLIPDKELDNYDSSQSFSRLKTSNIMKKNGIKGKWDKTNEKFKSIKLVSNKREIFPLGKNIYNNFSKNISFLYDDYKDILEKNTTKDEYLEFLRKTYGFNR